MELNDTKTHDFEQKTTDTHQHPLPLLLLLIATYCYSYCHSELFRAIFYAILLPTRTNHYQFLTKEYELNGTKWNFYAELNDTK